MVIMMKEKILYTISRIGIMLMANVICSILSITLVSWIANLFAQGGGSGFKKSLFEGGEVWSLIAWIMLLIILLILFIDDGIRHSAYERYDSVSTSIVLILMFAIYYIPALFIKKTSGKATTGFKSFYFPSKWISEKFSLDYEMAVLLGIGIILILCLAGYMIAHAFYKKKHPVLDWRVKNPNAEYASNDD